MVARSRATPGTGYFGDIPGGVWEVVNAAWETPFSLASNYARIRRADVAFAASMGWVSIISPDGTGYTTQWHITMEGIIALRNRTTM